MNEKTKTFAIIAIVAVTGIALVIAYSLVPDFSGPAQAQQQQQSQQGNFNAKLAGTNEVPAAGGNLSTVGHTGNNTLGGGVKAFLNQTGKALANAPGETNEFFSGGSESGGTENDTIGK